MKKPAAYTVLESLTTHTILKTLPPDELRKLFRAANPKTLAPGAYLCHQGDVCPQMIYLYSGEIRWLLLSMDGKEHILQTLTDRTLFWTHSFFDNQPMPASLIASKESIIYTWEQEVVLPTFYRYPQTMFAVMGILTGFMRQAREIIYGLAFQPVASRLAQVILAQAKTAASTTLERDLTLDEIATMCASSPEVICRLLYKFQRNGLIEVTRTHITIKDIEKLQQLLH